tara:strand:- start:133 stop:375 length:243 start_codon:yes stop_codon:yes gene_type:complete
LGKIRVFILPIPTFGDNLVFQVSYTSDETSPLIKTQTLILTNAESDKLAVDGLIFVAEYEGKLIGACMANRGRTGTKAIY